MPPHSMPSSSPKCVGVRTRDESMPRTFMASLKLMGADLTSTSTSPGCGARREIAAAEPPPDSPESHSSKRTPHTPPGCARWAMAQEAHAASVRLIRRTRRLPACHATSASASSARKSSATSGRKSFLSRSTLRNLRSTISRRATRANPHRGAPAQSDTP